MPDDRRRQLFRAPPALGFLQLSARAPELRLLHRWLDTWAGIGLVAVGMHRQGYGLSLTYITEDEWRATFQMNPMFAPTGFGVRRRRGERCRIDLGSRGMAGGEAYAQARAGDAPADRAGGAGGTRHTALWPSEESLLMELV